MKKVICQLYYREGYPSSKIALELLESREVDYTAHCISRVFDRDGMEGLLQEVLQRLGVGDLPTLVLGDLQYVGLAQIREFLKPLGSREHPRIFIPVPLGRMPGFDEKPKGDVNV